MNTRIIADISHDHCFRNHILLNCFRTAFLLNLTRQGRRKMEVFSFFLTRPRLRSLSSRSARARFLPLPNLLYGITSMPRLKREPVSRAKKPLTWSSALNKMEKGRPQQKKHIRPIKLNLVTRVALIIKSSSSFILPLGPKILITHNSIEITLDQPRTR